MLGQPISVPWSRCSMMEVDSEFMLEDVLLEFVKAQLEDEQKKVELEKTEGQSTIEHEVELMSLDVAEKQVELQYGIVDDNMNPSKRETLEEAML